jgi:hypothetical protein
LTLAGTVVRGASHFHGATTARSVAWPLRGSLGGVLGIISIRGMVTASVLRSLAARAAHIECQDESLASVVLYSRAAIVLADAEELVDAERGLVRAGYLRNPRAMVVAEDDLPEFRRYAALMADFGVGRFVFTAADTAQALGWARSMGLLIRAARACPSPQAIHRL